MALTMQQMELEIKRLRAEVEAMRRPKSVAKLVMSSGSVRLYVFTTTTAFASLTATANITTMSGSSVATGATLNDPTGHMADVISGSKGICVEDGGNYYALTPYVVGLRVNALTLQARKENASDAFWATWHSGDNCT